MNANARFLNEARELETRWSKTGILKGIEDPYVRSSTAVLLENQRLQDFIASSSLTNTPEELEVEMLDSQQIA
jgi:histidinol phosphatase-like PHP family hydrolase